MLCACLGTPTYGSEYLSPSTSASSLSNSTPSSPAGSFSVAVTSTRDSSSVYSDPDKSASHRRPNRPQISIMLANSQPGSTRSSMASVANSEPHTPVAGDRSPGLLEVRLSLMTHDSNASTGSDDNGASAELQNLSNSTNANATNGT